MKTLFITGASSGIGRACALEFAKQLPDASLILLGRDTSALEEVRAAIGDRAAIVTCDLSTREGQDQACTLVQQKAPDLLINSAGLGYYGPAHAHDLEKEREIVEVNITALQMLTLTCVQTLQRASKQGTIVNLSSAAAYLSFPGSATYAASKAFVSRFSEAVDVELQGTEIRVLVFCPGVVATSFSHRASQGKPLALVRKTVIPVEKVASAIWHQVETGKGVVIYNWRYRLSLKLLPLAPKRWLGRYLKKRVE